MVPPAKAEDAMKRMKDMGPAMGSMMEGMMGGMLQFWSKPETAEAMASFTKNYYDALIKKGFTEEQALKIIEAAGGAPRTR